MARKNNQLVYILETLKDFKSISNIDISRVASLNGDKKDLNSKFEEGDMISGTFEYDNLIFSFVDRCSDIMGLHRISCPFNFEVKELKSKLSMSDINESIRRFELLKIGIKAILKDVNESGGEFSVIFSIDLISSGDKRIVDKDSVVSYINILKTSPDFFWDLYDRSVKEDNGK